MNLRILLLTLVSVNILGCQSTSTKNDQTQSQNGPTKVLEAATESAATGGGDLIRYKYAKGELTKLCKRAMDDTRKAIEEVIAIPDKKKNFENTVLTIEQLSADFSDVTNPLLFQGSVNTQQYIRDEATSCESEVGQFLVSLFTRRDLYLAWKKSVENTPKKDLQPEDKRLIEQSSKSFKKSGLELDDQKLEQVRELKKKLTVLESEFAKNLNEDTSYVAFTKDELQGLPESVLKRLEKLDDGKFKVTTKTPDFVPVMENVKNADVRHRLHTAYESRAAQKNMDLMAQALELRKQIAGIIGYKNWADLQIDGRMAQDSKTVLNFLNGLREKLFKGNKADLEVLLKAKQSDEKGAKKLDPWDIAYYANQVKKRDYKVDTEALREYFPAPLVIKGVFDIYSTLFNIKLVKLKNADVWHKDVELFGIRDGKSGEMIAHFFADFTPREGKYGHAAAFNLITGRELPSGKYQKPISAIVANFEPPTADRPSLLSHDEVETFFHEFGHIMHQTLTKARHSSLAGSSVARDFVEAPSQMLENWVWDPKILKSLSGHYKDMKKKLPDDLIKKLIKSRDFNKGFFYTRQLNFGLMDMTYHTSPTPLDLNKVYMDLYRQLFDIEPNPEGHFPGTFGHLMGGYDAGYYGYLWSEVYAEAMFERFHKAGLLNKKAGADYRKWILEKGDTIEAMELVTKFLGKKPTNAAFYKRLKIK